VLGARENAPLAPGIVLARYRAALATIGHPRFVAFDYDVEQLGLRNMEQTHRIYRSGVSERDETLVVDGYHLRTPAVRIISGRTDRYAIDRVAPKTADYDFVYTGAVNESDAYGYRFTTQSRGAAGFAVTDVEIDGRTFLPREIHFKIAGGNAHGSGTMTFAQVDRYWVVQDADVSAHLTNGTIARERLEWSNYRFPASLPESTFESPHATDVPAAAPTPGPLF
jgi:hypothetical protein